MAAVTALMPIECDLLDRAPVPLESCPKCGAKPFEPFMRGEVQRLPYVWWAPWRWRPDYCALICWTCKEIVGYEDPWEAAVRKIVTSVE